MSKSGVKERLKAKAEALNQAKEAEKAEKVRRSRMQSRILFCILQTFDTQPHLVNDEAFYKETLAEHCKEVLDSAWTKGIMLYLRMHVLTQQKEVDDFCFDYLNKLNIKKIDLGIDPATIFSNIYTEDYHTSNIQRSELKPGDIIRFNVHDGDVKIRKHTVIYVGDLNGEQMGISRPHVNHLCIHPIDATPANFGEPEYFHVRKKDIHQPFLQKLKDQLKAYQKEKDEDEEVKDAWEGVANAVLHQRKLMKSSSAAAVDRGAKSEKSAKKKF